MAESLLDSVRTQDCDWLARGQLRDIYQHPRFPDTLIKVIRADRADAGGNVVGWGRRKLVANRQFGIYVTFLRELRELLRGVRRLYSQPDLALPYARPLGLVKTERGLGLMVEKLTAPDGSLAPTLKQLIRSGRFEDRHRALIGEFFSFAERHHIVFGDLNAGNLVLAEDVPGGRFVCIDGIGEKALLPVHELSAWVNARKLRRLRRRLEAYVERHVSRKARTVAALKQGEAEPRREPVAPSRA